MLAGHYAAAYALRASRPSTPLWMLVFAVQAVDIVFFVLASTGIETLAVNPGSRGPLAMNLVSIPYTHSFVMNVIYAAGVIVAGFLVRRAAIGIVVAAALFSHWALDVFVHTPDLPLTIAQTTKIGLGLWRYPVAALLLETGLLLAGYALLRRTLSAARSRRWADIGAGVLVLTQVTYVLGPPPATIFQMAAAGEVIYVVMIVLAYQVDRHAR